MDLHISTLLLTIVQGLWSLPIPMDLEKIVCLSVKNFYSSAAFEFERFFDFAYEL